jgi:type I restriction enzyme S subunit
LDERIALTADKVKLLKEQKQGYLQRVFAHEMVFTDDNGDKYPEWEQKKLGEVAEIIGGGTPSTGEPSYWDGDINWFSPTDVGKSKYLNESTRKITEAGLKNSSAKIHPVGTVLLTTRASLGRMGILRSEAATNQGFQSLLPRDNTTSEFLYYLQPQIETYCDVKASGSTFKEISGKEIAKMPVKLPSLPEQHKIAEFFSALDERIELTENKLTLLKEQKKGYLQGIFG